MRFIVPIFLIIVSIVLTVFYTMPTWDSVNALTIERDNLNSVLGKTKEFKDITTQKLNTYNSFPQAEMIKIDKLVSDNIDNVKLVINLNQIASLYGMNIKNISLRTDKSSSELVGPDTKEYNTATIGFSVSAPYSKFLSFLENLEYSLPLVNVSSLTFSSSDKESYDYNLEVKTYWLKSAQ